MTDSSCPTVLDEVFTLNGTDSVGSLPGLANYSSSDSDHSSYSDSESTDVEDAVCTLYDIAASRVRKAKSQSGEEG